MKAVNKLEMDSKWTLDTPENGRKRDINRLRMAPKTIRLPPTRCRTQPIFGISAPSKNVNSRYRSQSRQALAFPPSGATFSLLFLIERAGE
jgi:hypothetical protein